MLSSLRNYTNNLQYSEKFYYDNYEYYNDYENIQKDYKEDLSKVFFKCKRKSKGKIIIYRYINASQTHLHHLYDKRLFNQSQKESQMMDDEGNVKTMEELLYPFVNIYFQNNYKISRPIRQENLEGLQLIYHPDYQSQSLNTKLFDQYFIAFIQNLKAENEQTITALSEQNNYLNLDMDYKIEWFRFQNYYRQILQTVLQQKRQITDQDMNFGTIYQFSNLIFNTLNQMITAKTWNSLILAQPNSPILSKVIHPLVFGINQFTKMVNQTKKNNLNGSNQPNIVFINMDGIDSPSNIKAIKSLSGNILYISIYKQPQMLELKHCQLQNHVFRSICQAYSEIMMREIQREDINIKSNESKSLKYLIFPMNSHYLRKKYYQKLQESKHRFKKYPQLKSSQDIMFLFEGFLYQEIREFNPTMVLMSYNGMLDIKEDHFIDIVRNLTIVADHKVLLFTNLTHLFKPKKPNQDEQIDRSDYEHLDEFFLRYMAYEFSQIKSTHDGTNLIHKVNTERLYHNLGMFMKISTGSYSSQERIIDSPLNKYFMSQRYFYLETLASYPGFQHINKHILLKWRSDQIQNLYRKYGKWQIKENKKFNQTYQRMIDQVIKKLFKILIDQDNSNLTIYYRLKQIEASIMNEFDYNYGMQQNQILEGYMEEHKQKLLLQNLENYKTKKAYYLKQTFEDEQGIVISFKFQLKKNQNKEDIYFEKYTQILFEENGTNVIIVNYRDEHDRYLILHGKIQEDQEIIQVSQVLESIPKQSKRMEQQLSKSRISDNQPYNNRKNSMVYVNYSHFFLNKSLYLFWPQECDIEDQVRHKLLTLQYKPLGVNKFIRVNIQQKMGDESQYQELIFKNQEKVEVPPRYGCSIWGEDGERFFIFGGINDNFRDLTESNTGISVATISTTMGNSVIKIQNLPKRQSKSASKYKTFKQFQNGSYSQVRLKPKINYKIEVNHNSNNGKELIISGGYGRQTTGFYNMFSYQKYIFNYEDKILTYMESDRSLVNLFKPIQISNVGKYPISKEGNLNEIQEKFSNQLKDKFLFQTGYQKTQQHGSKEVKEIISFIDENYRVNDYKSDHKKIYLFGFNRNIRQKIYTKFWSPELYIEERQRIWIVNITLKLDKIQQFSNNANQLIPRQDDLISICLEEDRIYALSICSTFQLQNQSEPKVLLYAGELVNMNDILRKNQIIMNQIYKFDFIDSIKYLISKTVYVMDEKIFILGGLPKNKYNYSEDYILEQKAKNKYKLKIRKVQSIEQSPDSLQLQFPFIIKHENYHLLYSLIEDMHINIDHSITKTKWKLKIQTFTEESKTIESVLVCQLRLYYRSKNIPNPIRIACDFKQPKFSMIVKYRKFNFDLLKEIIQKVVLRLHKKQILVEQIKKLKIIMNNSDQSLMRRQIYECKQFFQNILNKVIPMVQAEKNEPNLEDQDLIKDLKACYSKINKLILQDLLMIDQNSNSNQYLFVVQDKGVSQKVKYLAIGSLGNSKLVFFKIRFKHQLMMCLNSDFDFGLFYHPTERNFYDMVEEKRLNIYKEEIQKQIQENVVKSIRITIKN